SSLNGRRRPPPPATAPASLAAPRSHQPASAPTPLPSAPCPAPHPAGPGNSPTPTAAGTHSPRGSPRAHPRSVLQPGAARTTSRPPPQSGHTRPSRTVVPPAAPSLAAWDITPAAPFNPSPSEHSGNPISA